MDTHLGRVCVVAEQQHGVVARWQLVRWGWSRTAIDAGMRGLRRVFRGVCALGDLTERGWFMAAALAGGPGAVVSHLSALQVMDLRPCGPGDIHVTLPKRSGAGHREGIIFHRPVVPPEIWKYKGIPVTSPNQSLRDADLKPHELYRALDIAERRGIPVDLRGLPPSDVVRLKQTIRGRTRSESEALFLWRCHRWGLPLPRVNEHLNGFETDFHWPELRLVVEVDGWEHHRERPHFNTDRYRGLVHRANGYEVVRISADHVYDEPDLILEALTYSRGSWPNFTATNARITPTATYTR